MEPKNVKLIQDRIVEALKLQLERNHSSKPNLFLSVMQKLPELRQISSQVNQILDWFRHRWQCLNLLPLFAEIFDIPKSEDEVQQS